MRALLRYLPLSILLASCYAKEAPVKKETADYLKKADAAYAGGQYKAALGFYNKAQELGVADEGELLFKKAVCAAALDQDVKEDYIRAAVAFGFKDEKRLKATAAKLKENNNLEWYFQQAVEKDQDRTASAYASFKAAFPPAKFPIHLDTAALHFDQDYTGGTALLETYFPQLRKGMFSRDAGFTSLNIASIRQQDFDAYVIALQDYFNEDAPMGFYLLTLTHEGKLIERRQIGGLFEDGTSFGEVTITKDLDILMKQLRLKFAPGTEDEEKKLTGIEYQGEKRWKLSAQGRIDEVATL